MVAFSLKSKRFLVDDHGKPEAVILSLTDYRRLVHLIEDLEDAVELRRAIRTSSGTLSHANLLARLKRQNLL